MIGKTARLSKQKVTDLLEGNAFYYKACNTFLDGAELTVLYCRTLKLAPASRNTRLYPRFFTTRGLE